MTVLVIRPYKVGRYWVFDDPEKEIIVEPFVGNVNYVINQAVAGLDHPEDGFKLEFSDQPFEGAEEKPATRLRKENGGYRYLMPAKNGVTVTGWLCPRLFSYFEQAPKEIYIRASNLDQPLERSANNLLEAVGGQKMNNIDRQRLTAEMHNIAENSQAHFRSIDALAGTLSTLCDVSRETAVNFVRENHDFIKANIAIG